MFNHYLKLKCTKTLYADEWCDVIGLFDPGYGMLNHYVKLKFSSVLNADGWRDIVSLRDLGDGQFNHYVKLKRAKKGTPEREKLERLWTPKELEQDPSRERRVLKAHPPKCFLKTPVKV